MIYIMTFAQSFIDGRENRKKRSMFVYYFNITNFSKTPHHSPPAAHALGTTDKRHYSKIYLPIYGLLQIPVDFHSAVYTRGHCLIQWYDLFFFLSLSINMDIMDIFMVTLVFRQKKSLRSTMVSVFRCTVIEELIVVTIMIAVCGVGILFSAIKWFVLEF